MCRVATCCVVYEMEEQITDQVPSGVVLLDLRLAVFCKRTILADAPCQPQCGVGCGAWAGCGVRRFRWPFAHRRNLDLERLLDAQESSQSAIGPGLRQYGLRRSPTTRCVVRWIGGRNQWAARYVDLGW